MAKHSAAQSSGVILVPSHAGVSPATDAGQSAFDCPQQLGTPRNISDCQFRKKQLLNMTGNLVSGGGELYCEVTIGYNPT